MGDKYVPNEREIAFHEAGHTVTGYLFYRVRSVSIVPAELEGRYLVQGQHEAIITEKLYYEVQDVLDGKKRAPHGWYVFTNRCDEDCQY